MIVYMLLLIFIIILIVYVSYTFYKYKQTQKPITVNKPPQIQDETASRFVPYRNDSTDDMPITTEYNKVGVNLPSTILTEQMLLKQSRMPRPEPKLLYNTGDRFTAFSAIVGDLPIRPRQSGIMIPYNADVADFNVGYFDSYRNQ